MPVATDFEDLVAWQRARALVRVVYQITRQPPLDRDFGLRDQMQRAATSVMSNIAEGFGYHNRAQFVRFLSMALGSCAELRSQLYVARDAGYLDLATFQACRRDAEAVARLIGALRMATIRLIQRSSREERMS